MSKAATLAETTAHTIRDGILTGVYLSGERLIELTLAGQLSVSQNTVRDALRILELDGWVIKRPRRGVYVRQFTPEEAVEIFALLASIESLALGWAMAKMAKQQYAELRRLLDTARKDYYAGKRREAIEVLFKFHEQIAAFSEKATTIQLLEQLYNQVRLLEAVRQLRAPANPQELDRRIHRHEILLKLLQAGDLENARVTLTAEIEAYSALCAAALTVP